MNTHSRAMPMRSAYSSSLPEARFGRVARHAAQVAMQIPNLSLGHHFSPGQNG